MTRTKEERGREERPLLSPDIEMSDSHFSRSLTRRAMRAGMETYYSET